MSRITMDGHGVWISTRRNGRKDSPEFKDALAALNASEERLRKARAEVDAAQDENAWAWALMRRTVLEED